MDPSNIIAGAALVVSIVSAIFSAYVVFRDKARLRTQSRILRHVNHDESEVRVIEAEAVNIGRRPIVLAQFEKRYDSGWIGTLIGEKGRGISLAEQERHEERLLPHEDGPDEELDLAFRDTTGRRHLVKNARPTLRKLYAQKCKNEEH